jgi:hypothetical protein
VSNEAETQAGETERNDINVSSIVVIGLVSVILLVVIVVGTQAYFYNAQDQEVFRKDVSQPSWQLNNLLLQQQAELGGYKMVDRDKGVVAIPIDVAMKRFVQRQATQPASAPK